MSKPRVVFDCNIYLQAAVRNTGPAFACLELAEAKEITLLTSTDILTEVVAVLSRPSIRQKFSTLTDELLTTFVERLMQIVEFIPDVPAVFRFTRDPKDEPYLNLAITGQATYLVSRDKDILNLRNGMEDESQAFREKYPLIEVIDPVEFLRNIRRIVQSH